MLPQPRHHWRALHAAVQQCSSAAAERTSTAVPQRCSTWQQRTSMHLW
jgi:hypothetical protein